MTNHKPLLRSDYRPLDFKITDTYLDIKIDSPLTTVKSKLHFVRENKQATKFILNGSDLNLLSIKVDGKDFNDYELIVHPGRGGFQDLVVDVSNLENKDVFDLEIENTFDLDNNLTLSGIYKAGQHVCSQCEAESFRKITFHFDRPDNLSIFTVKLTSNKELYPHLLSNGNKIDEGDLDNGLHYTVWHDPFPKPCYLFACVGGKFDVLEDYFVTMSGRKVDIRVYAEEGKGHLIRFATDAIKRSMKWDEERFGLEYDLDLFMVVAVSFFNMGAMENKGLNIFNDSLLIGDYDNAHDDTLKRIDKVIAHEYFHNWTGDRVTCRDWFQLTLKEGLTVFRDQEYTSDTVNRAVERLESVNAIAFNQFEEDQGPLSHPIRPESVKEQDNFYTITIYYKGSEVIRMIHTLIGEENFQKGMKLYFQRHDGKAVTCDDFVDAMQDASGYDFTKFRKWYSQSGTPIVHVETDYDAQTRQCIVKFKQVNPPTNDQTEKEPLVLPLRTEFLSPLGEKLTNLVDINGNKVEELIVVDSAEKVLVLKDLDFKPLVVTNLGFSAPVKLELPYSLEELALICSNTTDHVARNNAVTKVYDYLYKYNLERLNQNLDVEVPSVVSKIFGELLANSLSNPALYAHLLNFTTPKAASVSFDKNLDPLKLERIFRDARAILYSQFKDLALEIYEKLPTFYVWEYTSEQFGVRALARVLLNIITADGSHKYLVTQRYDNAICLTDRQMAVAVNIVNRLGLDELEERYQARYRDNPNVLDGYLSTKSANAANLDEVIELTKHFNYDNTNPNRVRSVLNMLMFNFKVMYDVSGKTFEWLAQEILRIDEFNPHLSSTVTDLLTNFYKMSEPHYSNMLKCLEFLNTHELSNNVKEKLELALKMAENK